MRNQGRDRSAARGGSGRRPSPCRGGRSRCLAGLPGLDPSFPPLPPPPNLSPVGGGWGGCTETAWWGGVCSAGAASQRPPPRSGLSSPARRLPLPVSFNLYIYLKKKIIICLWQVERSVVPGEGDEGEGRGRPRVWLPRLHLTGGAVRESRSTAPAWGWGVSLFQAPPRLRPPRPPAAGGNERSGRTEPGTALPPHHAVPGGKRPPPTPALRLSRGLRERRDQALSLRASFSTII